MTQVSQQGVHRCACDVESGIAFEPFEPRAAPCAATCYPHRPPLDTHHPVTRPTPSTQSNPVSLGAYRSTACPVRQCVVPVRRSDTLAVECVHPCGEAWREGLTRILRPLERVRQRNHHHTAMTGGCMRDAGEGGGSGTIRQVSWSSLTQSSVACSLKRPGLGGL